MSRGGRGGATGGRIRAQQLPFEVAELEDDVIAHGEDKRPDLELRNALFPVSGKSTAFLIPPY